MNAKSEEVYKSYSQYVYIRGFAENTVTVYLKEAKEYLEYVYDIEYTTAEITKEYLKRYSNCSKATRNLHTVCLQVFVGYVSKNLYSTIDDIKFHNIKMGRKLPEIYEQKEFIQKLNIIKDTAEKTNNWIDKRNYALILLMYSTGMRVSEALKFNLTNLENNWIRINGGKGGIDRYVPIAQTAINALYDYMEVCPYPLKKAFFISYQTTVLSRISAFKVLKKLMGLSPHSMRHHFATHMIINGCEISVVSELLGHSSLQSTQIYTHIKNPQLAETVNKCHPMAIGELHAI